MANDKINGKVISFINMKGGVGKTTLTKEVGYHLANSLNKKVLLIDIDPQINLTQSIFKIFGYAQSKELADNQQKEDETDTSEEKSKQLDNQKYIITSASIQNILSGNISFENPSKNLNKAILNIPDTNLSIIPGEFGLDFVTRNLNGGQLENGLYNFIEKNSLRSSFDYILIDCPPTYSSYTIAALKPSDFYIIPVKPEAYSMLGVDMLEKIVKKIISDNEIYFHEKPLNNLGIVITDVKTNPSKGIQNLIDDIKNSKVLRKNNIKTFESKFIHNPSLQNNMSYLIDTSNAEKESKPNLVNLVEELVSRIQSF